MSDTSAATGPQTLDAEARTSILNAEVARYASKGWTVASVTPAQAILQRKKKIGLWLNLILTLCTGVWLIVVIYKLVNRKTVSLVLTVDAFGKISQR